MVFILLQNPQYLNTPQPLTEQPERTETRQLTAHRNTTGLPREQASTGTSRTPPSKAAALTSLRHKETWFCHSTELLPTDVSGRRAPLGGGGPRDVIRSRRLQKAEPHGRTSREGSTDTRDTAELHHPTPLKQPPLGVKTRSFHRCAMAAME